MNREEERRKLEKKGKARFENRAVLMERSKRIKVG